MSALSSNNASNASGLSVLSNRLRDITANGVFFTKSSKTCPNNMIPIASLLSHLAFLFTFIAKLGHLGRAALPPHDCPVRHRPPNPPSMAAPIRVQAPPHADHHPQPLSFLQGR